MRVIRASEGAWCICSFILGPGRVVQQEFVMFSKVIVLAHQNYTLLQLLITCFAARQHSRWFVSGRQRCSTCKAAASTALTAIDHIAQQRICCMILHRPCDDPQPLP